LIPDLRIYGVNNRLALAGEVKLPGTAEGRNPYNSDLISDMIGTFHFLESNKTSLLTFQVKKNSAPRLEAF
jgi:hypothetical protein